MEQTITSGAEFSGRPVPVEQQAYLSATDGRIGWMRVVCSGFRPVISPQ